MEVGRGVRSHTVDTGLKVLYNGVARTGRLMLGWLEKDQTSTLENNKAPLGVLQPSCLGKAQLLGESPGSAQKWVGQELVKDPALHGYPSSWFLRTVFVGLNKYTQGQPCPSRIRVAAGGHSHRAASGSGVPPK